jgi:hypothetical protein
LLPPIWMTRYHRSRCNSIKMSIFHPPPWKYRYRRNTVSPMLKTQHRCNEVPPFDRYQAINMLPSLT